MFISFTLIRRAPRLCLLTLMFISIFLLAFLLLGCTKPNQSYSNMYIAEYKFNQTSSIFPKISNAYNLKNLTGVQDMTVRVGYLGLCLELHNSTTCSATNDLTVFQQYTGVQIISTSASSNISATELDLVSLGVSFANNVCHPYILIASLVLSFFTFCLILWCTLGFLPARNLAKKISMFTSGSTAILWGLGGMLAHEAASSSSQLLGPASLYMISATAGTRANAMTWTAFCFISITFVGTSVLYIRDLKEKAEEIEPKL